MRIRRLGVQRRIHLNDASSAVTDESGASAVTTPSGESDRFVLDVEADGWVPQSSGVLGSGSAGNTGVGGGSLESVLISLESRAASLSGQVTAVNGSSKTGITVLIGVRTQPASTGIAGTPGDGPVTRTIRPHRLTFRTRAVTDSDGRYSVSGLPPGTLSVVAIQRGVRIPVQRFLTVEGEAYDANFVMPN